MSLREQAMGLVERVRRVRDEQAAAGKELAEYEGLSDVLEAIDTGAFLVKEKILTEDDYHLGLTNASAMALEPYGEISDAEIAKITEQVRAYIVAHQIDPVPLIVDEPEQPLSKTEPLPVDAPSVPEPRQVTGDLPSEILASALAKESALDVFGEQDPGGDS